MKAYMYGMVKTYMLQNLEDNTDPQTNEINTTQLAEDAFGHFDFLESDLESCFEIASQVVADIDDYENGE